MNQKNASPLDYLFRLRLWKVLFRSAPRALGITDAGQIVSNHEYITGEPPTQEQIDLFLTNAGLEPVRRQYWLWKKVYVAGPDIWLGDARPDNFIRTREGIVPIDIRVWYQRKV